MLSLYTSYTFMADKPNTYARADPNTGDLVQWERPKVKGGNRGIGVGSGAQKCAISPKRCKIGPKLLGLWRTNSKSHPALSIAPKSMTFG